MMLVLLLLLLVIVLAAVMGMGGPTIYRRGPRRRVVERVYEDRPIDEF